LTGESPCRPGRRRAGLACLFLAFVLVPAIAWAQERPIALGGATVLPVSGPPITDGMVVIAGGKIVAVGPAATTALPADAERIDVTGRVLMPGLVDTHSHVGGGGGADGSTPVQPDVRILDSINVRDAGFRKCRSGGLTTLNIMPGSGHLAPVFGRGQEFLPHDRRRLATRSRERSVTLRIGAVGHLQPD